MRYLIELKDRIHVKRYGFLSIAKNIGKHLTHKYGQKRLDRAKKSTMDVIKTALNTAIQKTAEPTGHLIGNKVADKIISASKKSSAEQCSKNDDINSEVEVPKKMHISRRKTTNYWWIKISTRKKCTFLGIIDELRLALKKDTYL